MQDATNNQFSNNPFQADPEITKAVDAVMKIVGARGSILYWEQIEQAAKCPRYTGSWQTIVNKVRKRLRTERMQATWPETNVGLRLLTHKETAIEIPKRRQRKMFVQSTKQLREMETADPTKLSMIERRMLANQIDQLKAERKAIRSAQKEILSAYETLPLRPILPPLPPLPKR